MLIGCIAAGCIGCGNTAETAKDSQQETAQAADIQQVDNSSDAGEGLKSEDINIEETDANVEETSEAMDEIPSLRDCIAENRGWLIGAAVTESEIQDEGVWNIITTHFATITLGNELKPDALFNYSNAKCPGTETTEINGAEIEVPIINYSRAEKMLDKVLDWNENNPEREIKVRGHVLVWHSQTPEWFFHEDYDKKNPYVDKETMNLRLEWYIRTVLTHFTGEDSKYKDLFYGWDVVNEAVSDDGKYRSDSVNPSEALSQDTHGSNSSWWAVYGSEEYIINAFKFANKYAPENLELYYNDYNECNAVKRAGIVELLKAVKAQEGEPGEGTRISAMGMQGHYGMTDPDISNVQSSIETYAEIVGNVQITEFDVKASSEYDGTDATKEEEYEKLRKRYNVLYYAMKAADSGANVNITSITFWGTVDKYSWLQYQANVGGGNSSKSAQCPLLFDDNYEPKSCFWVFTQ